MTQEKVQMDRRKYHKEKMIQERKDKTGAYPSRKEVHTRVKKQEEKNTKHKKLKYPVISILAVLFILLPVMILSYSYYTEAKGDLPFGGGGDFENIFIQKGSSGNVPAASIKLQKETKEETQTAEKEADERQEDSKPAQENVEEEPASVQSAEDTADPETSSPQNEASDTVPLAAQEENQPEEPQPAEEYDVISHTVGPEENLFRISMKYYNSRSGEELIRSWNNLHGNEIYQGQVLKIPIQRY
ncbi:LysM peptidoglycan-binding domain-containing protein [Bacillus lacus]|uniref:LysM peptidoglycan-binding domain-containing protein n=1 Tax=Metabacillus lacus TaxID=1983721 RepID=A0A7X2LYL8_9BACI|nr:LysM peptidoglycan-binding domain-containing protein [Metabacillus lacus]MRX71032.1 LysM peptidoglycan-binding domain-containing protein [Metabacillus lacus]